MRNSWDWKKLKFYNNLISVNNSSFQERLLGEITTSKLQFYGPNISKHAIKKERILARNLSFF